MSALITHDRSTPVTGSLLPYVETPAPAPLQTQQVAGELKDKNGGVSSQGVQLPAPLAVVASQVTEGQQQEVTKIIGVGHPRRGRISTDIKLCFSANEVYACFT